MISAQWGTNKKTKKKRGKSLHPVVRDGKLEKKNKLLYMPAKLNEADEQGMTPLMIAAMHNRAGATRLLLEIGRPYIRINEATASYGTTALMIAAMNGYGEVITELIAKKADLNKTNKYGLTALMLAARSGHSGVVQQLLKAGANRDTRDSSYKTAADHAATEEIRQLLANPATTHDDNTIPGIVEAMQRLKKLQGSPARFTALRFSMTGGDKERGYAYHFANQNGHTHLVHACDEFIVTTQRLSGTESDNIIALHFWDARTFGYINSIMHNGTISPGDGTLLSCDTEGKRFAIAYQQRYGKVTGVLAYHIDKGTLEYDCDFNCNTPLPFKHNDFIGMPAFTSAAKEIALNNTLALQEQKQFTGLAHHFTTTDETTLRSIDFDTLKSRPSPQQKIQTSIKAEEIAGLPPGTKVVRVNEGLGVTLCPNYAVCIPQTYNTLRDLVWKWKEDPTLKIPLSIYDKERKQLYSLPQSILDAIGENCTVVPFFGDSDCGKILHNVLAIHRNETKWCGSELYNHASGNYEKIIFNANNKAQTGATTAYRISADIEDTASLGSILSVWNSIPGDTTHSYWIAASATNCAIFLIDETNRTGSLIQKWQGTWGKTIWTPTRPTPVWLPKKKWLCIPTKEHCWEIYELQDPGKPNQKKFDLYTGAEGAWAIILKNGHYAGTPGCENLLYEQTEKGTRTTHALAPWRNRPAEVLEAIDGSTEVIAELREATRHRLADQDLDIDHMPAEPATCNLPEVKPTKTPLIAETPTLEFEATLTAGNTKALTTLEVRADGSLIPQDWENNLLIAAGQNQRINVRIPLRVGQNNIVLTPIDSMEQMGEPVRFRAVRPGKSESRLFVVAIGMTNANDSNKGNSTTGKDAQEIAASFAEHGTGEVKTLTLTDKETTPGATVEKARAFLAESTPEDRVVVYIGGNGCIDTEQKHLYIPGNTDKPQTDINLDEIVTHLQRIPARECLLVADFHHTSPLPAHHKYFIENLCTKNARKRGIHTIIGYTETAPDTTENAQNGSAITTALTRTLQNVSSADSNADGVLTAKELLESIQEQTSQLTKGVHRPHIATAENSGMVLAIDECNEVLKGDWAAICKRINKAPSAREALFILDIMAACREGRTNNMPWQPEQKNEHYTNIGRGYGDEDMELLARAYEMGRKAHTETNQSLPEIPLAVWEAALNKGVDSINIYHEFAWHWNTDAAQILRLLISKGLPPDCKNSEGVPILARVSTPLAQVLLEAGASANAQDPEGNTVLHRIARESWDNLHKNQIELLYLLFLHGADSKLKNNKGEPALPENSKHNLTIKAIEKLAKYRQSPASAPTPPEGLAPTQLDNNVLLCTYHIAEVSSHDISTNKTSGFKPINKQTFGMLTRAYPAVDSSTIRTYTKTGPNTAKIQILRHCGPPAFCKLLAESAGKLTAEQIRDIIKPLAEKNITELELTFSTPTTATATEVNMQNANITQTLRNVQVTIRQH